MSRLIKGKRLRFQLDTWDISRFQAQHGTKYQISIQKCHWHTQKPRDLFKNSLFSLSHTTVPILRHWCSLPHNILILTLLERFKCWLFHFLFLFFCDNRQTASQTHHLPRRRQASSGNWPLCFAAVGRLNGFQCFFFIVY